MRCFNVTGSCDPARHYMIPAERRLPGVQALIDKQAYFVVHAPRQTGKTTAMKALAQRLTDEGRYAGLRFSCQNASVFPEDVRAAERSVWQSIQERPLARRSRRPSVLRRPSKHRKAASSRPSSLAGPRAALARWS